MVRVTVTRPGTQMLPVRYTVVCATKLALYVMPQALLLVCVALATPAGRLALAAHVPLTGPDSSAKPTRASVTQSATQGIVLAQRPTNAISAGITHTSTRKMNESATQLGLEANAHFISATVLYDAQNATVLQKLIARSA